MRAKVERIVYKDFTLFDNGVFLKKHLLTTFLLFGDEQPNDIHVEKLSLELTLDFGGRKYTRSGEIECTVDGVDVVEERKMTPICVPSKDNLNLK